MASMVAANMIIIIRILFTASGRCLSVSQPITTTCRINVHLQPLLGQVCFIAALLLTERCFSDRTRQQVSAVSVGINYNNDDPIPTTPPKFLRAGCPSCCPTNMTGDFAAARFATAYSSGEVTRLDRS